MGSLGGGAPPRCRSHVVRAGRAGGGGAARRTAAGGKDGDYGYEFSDDPLSAGGFGPNDATIRVRPGPGAHDADSPAHVVRAGDAEVGREHLSLWHSCVTKHAARAAARIGVIDGQPGQGEGRAHVRALSGRQLVRRDTIAQDIVKVGKDPRSHLRVDDELASRMHAVIEVASPADITLIDLGNEPGTLVNGQRVNKCKIRPGDQIQIGSTLIVLENAEPATAAPPQVAAPPAAPRRRACRARRPAAAAAAPRRAAQSVRGREPVRRGAGCGARIRSRARIRSPAPAAPAAAAPFAPPSTPFVAQAAPPAPRRGVGLGIEPPLDGGPAATRTRWSRAAPT